MDNATIARVEPALAPWGIKPGQLAGLLEKAATEEAAKWAGIADKMRAAGFDPDKGDLLIMPSNLLVTHQPAWVRVSHLFDKPMMMRNPAALGITAPQ